MVGTEMVGSLVEDLCRRDLTINAMAMDVRGKLIDPVMGEGDLQLGRIRFVGFAPDRIKEDPNRIFRAARFAATIDGYFSNHAIDSLTTYAHLAASVAPERIREEILKVMKVEKPSIFFTALNQMGLLKHLFPELYKTIEIDGGPYHKESVFVHSMIVGDSIETDNPMLRLIAFLHDIGKIEPNYIDEVIHFYHHHEIGADMIKRNLEALRFTNAEVKFAYGLVLSHMRGAIKARPKAIRKILKFLDQLGVDWKDWVALKVADRKGNLARDDFDAGAIRKLQRKFEHEIDPKTSPASNPHAKKHGPAYRIKDLAMSGTRIQELLNIGPSQIIGVILEYLLARVINDPELNTPEQLEKMIIGKPKKLDIICKGKEWKMTESRKLKEKMNG
jgi:tRNA nucleotidyltransferase/poly(A) polymerase